MTRAASAPSRRGAAIHTVLRLIALAAAGLAVPWLLDHLGVRDVNWAPPEAGVPAAGPEEAAPPAPGARGADEPKRAAD